MNEQNNQSPRKIIPGIELMLVLCAGLLIVMMVFFFVSRSIASSNKPDESGTSEATEEQSTEPDTDPEENDSEEMTSTEAQSEEESTTVQSETEAETETDGPKVADAGFTLPSKAAAVSAPTFTGNGKAAEYIYSDNAILVDLASKTAIASKGTDEKIYPASMTKVMTILILCENLKEEDLYKLISLDTEVVREAQRQNASGVGLREGEKVYLCDLMYMALLQSDGIACVTLANYLSGSEQNFVALMNTRAAEMGLVNTHFSNCTGLHDNNHYTTVREMAMIFACAIENPAVRTILETEVRKAETNFYKPRTIYNSMLTSTLYKYSEPYPASLTVVCGKTGLTDEAKSCMVTLARNKSGKYFVAVNAHAASLYYSKLDHVRMYDTYATDSK